MNRASIFRWTVAGVLLVTAGVIFYAASRPIDPPQPIGRISDGSATPAAGLDPSEVPTTESSEDLLGLGPLPAVAPGRDRRPILPPPTGARLLLDTASPEDPPLVRTSVWQIADATLTDTASYFKAQAINEDFNLLSESHDPSQNVIRLALGQTDRWLTVRCRQVGAVIRVVVELRYTTAIGSH